MQASVQSRQQERNFGTVMENRKDDDLTLFRELENHAMERNELLLKESDDFVDQLAPKQDRSLPFNTMIAVPQRRTGVDAFLNSDNDKTDYDWLITPPDTPLFPSLEMEQDENIINQIVISNGHTTASESMHAKPHTQVANKNNETVKPSVSSNGRPSSSGGSKPTASRPATPTGRATLPANKKPSRPSTPTSRPILPATTKPARSSTPTSRAKVPSSTKPSRPSTPTSWASLPTAVKPSRPSTPTSRASLPSTTKPHRPSTPTSRSSFPATVKPSRPSTPTSRPMSRSSTPTRSSSVTKPGPKVVKNPGPLRGSSPIMKSRPSKSCEMPGFSKDTPPNLKKTLPDRPSSASRSRPGPPSVRSSSTGRTRQNGSVPSSGFSVLAMSRGHSMNGDDVNPVLMGTKMVERVVNMRKLPPPKQDDHVTNNSLGKTLSSQESLGRTLSKTSLDMAMRHMDITRRIPGNLRPLVTSTPASSVYSVRSGPPKSRTISSSDSPLATSSNASSEPSVNNGTNCLDEINVEDIYFVKETAAE